MKIFLKLEEILLDNINENIDRVDTRWIWKIINKKFREKKHQLIGYFELLKMKFLFFIFLNLKAIYI